MPILQTRSSRKGNLLDQVHPVINTKVRGGNSYVFWLQGYGSFPLLQSLFLHFILLSQFSRSVVSDSLRPQGLQHARLPCPSPTPGACSNSCASSRWWHPTISSSVIPFSSCLQFFPASGSFQMSQLFASGGQSIGVTASTSVLPMNTQDWSPPGWTGWISLQSKELSSLLQKHQFFGAQLFL